MFSGIDHPVLLALLAVALFPVYGLWAWLLFGSARNAIDAVRWVFVRDSKSFWNGDYVEDKLAELRLVVLVGLCSLSLAAAYKGASVMLRLLFGSGV